MVIGPLPEPTPSFWLANMPPTLIPQAASMPPATCDIAIVGAGMTGCALAYWLQRLREEEHEQQQHPLSIVLLDARGCAGGATGRNGGHLWANPASKFEADTTRELLEFIETHDVDCDLTIDGAAALARAQSETGVSYFDAPDDPENAGQEEEWDQDASSTWDSAERCQAGLQSEAFCHATLYPKAAQFYPAKVTAALLRAAGPSVQYCAPVRVLAIEQEEAAADDAATNTAAAADAADAAAAAAATTLVRWARGDGQQAEGVLRARRVAVCTNGWASELLPELSSCLYPTRNCVLMTQPLPAVHDWKIGAWSVDSDVGARELYAIRRPDGRICLGGARALEEGAAVGSSDDASLSPTVGAYLRRFLRERFPSLGPIEVEAEWSGVLGFTKDGQPMVGRLPSRDGVYVAAGFNGHGMPQCFGAGKALASMLLADAPRPPREREEEAAEQQGVQHQRAPDEAVHPHILEVANPARFFVS